MAGIGKVLKVGSTVLAAAGGVAGAAEVVTTVVEHYTVEQVHEIETLDKYTINGVEVTLDEWNSYLNNGGTKTTTQVSGTNEVTINASSFDVDGVSRNGLANYIDFDWNSMSKCIRAKVISDRVTKVTYDYSGTNYMSFTDGVTFDGTGYSSYIHQDVTRTDINGLVFTVGTATQSTYDLTFEVNDLGNDYYLFYFANSSISFTDIFNSITLTIA